MRRNPSLLIPSVFLLLSVSLIAQDTPIGPTGTQAAREETPQQQAAAQQTPSGGAADLQKATQNPVASLISVPIQNNSNFGIGPNDRTQNVLNIQPVVPIRASENWNLIIRSIVPVIWQPAPGTANLEVFGIDENTPAYLAAQAVGQNVYSVPTLLTRTSGETGSSCGECKVFSFAVLPPHLPWFLSERLEATTVEIDASQEAKP